jgi:hypothetical protein
MGRRASGRGSSWGELGWEAERVKIDGDATRGFLYDLAARGIAAGAWDQYRDALNDEYEDDARVADAPTGVNAPGNPEGNSERVTPEGVTPESNSIEDEDENEGEDEQQVVDINGVTFETEIVEDAIWVDGNNIYKCGEWNTPIGRLKGKR